MNKYSDRHKSEWVGKKDWTNATEVKYSGVRIGISRTKPSRATAPAQFSMCVDDLYQFCDKFCGFSCRNERLSAIVWT